MSITYLTFELLIAFFMLFIVVKIVGRRIINQVSAFTFLCSLVIAELVGNAIYDASISVWYMVYALALWGGLLFSVEYIGQKWLLFRKWIDGKPAALIKDGVIDREELKKNKMNINQLQSLLRQNETFSLREVAYCYLEPSGSLSIFKKTSYQKTTLGDFQFAPRATHVPVTLIRDGQVLWDELRDLGFNKYWLISQLKTQNIHQFEDVLIAEWLEGDGIFIQTK